jgi:hypothetical protein
MNSGVEKGGHKPFISNWLMTPLLRLTPLLRSFSALGTFSALKKLETG